jgi:oxaloacetate decarboxylase gamma subunit
LLLSATWFALGGMAIVFATLAVLMAVMFVLNLWLRPEPKAKTAAPHHAARHSAARKATDG